MLPESSQVPSSAAATVRVTGVTSAVTPPDVRGAFRAAAQAQLAVAVNHPDALMLLARALAERGVAVFPVNGKKRPLTARGFLDASTDLDTITRRWRFAWRMKGARIATATGGGVTVVDVDPRHGGTADPRLPATLTVSTMSGGVHLYFAGDGAVPCSVSRLAAGVDVRGEGGYVVIPPSADYAVLRDLPIARMPDWLVDLACTPGGGVSRGGAVTRGGPIVKLGERIAAGSRNAGLASVTGQLLDRGWEGGQLEERVLAYSKQLVDPPLGEAEVRRIVASV
ncbi:MAG: hypothetical protein JWM31_2397, partial [Solirubrobacterales bacterium]|nr:hypothetical protein [Solirubrobacterales bacterium]